MLFAELRGELPEVVQETNVLILDQERAADSKVMYPYLCYDYWHQRGTFSVHVVLKDTQAKKLSFKFNSYSHACMREYWALNNVCV